MTERIIPIVDQRDPLPLPAGGAFTPGAHIADTRGRALRDLRVSVTDRCNFRCTYCMPREVFGPDYAFLQRDQLLNFEEITRVVRLFKALGVEKVRLTGGEPLLRRNLEGLIGMLAPLGLDLTLTTNGSLLTKKARALKAAGLKRITVSLDSPDERVFQAMNDAEFPVSRVLEGIDAAAAAGLAPIKINMVVKRGVNDTSILPMARHFRGSGHIVRFIEFMDVGATNGWRMDEVIPSSEIVRMISAEMPLEPAAAHYTGEVAARWRYADGAGEIGVISSVTQAFCRDCTRLRLSTEGMLYTCLFASKGNDLRALLRSGASDADLQAGIARLWQARSDRYSEIRTEATAREPRIEMSYIGG
ncbi:MAG: GTP 3',8-cyclase MoaA [Betaproteobacteria bacterium]|nr:GTP 3',8-cyclase MoaA [Betaproteobacteria bacterium]